MQPTPKDFSRAFEQAVRLYQDGRRDEALSACDAILAMQQSHCDALHLRGVIYYQSGRNAQASHSLEAALSVRPANLPVLSGLGLVYVRLNRFADAVAAYDKLLAIDPGNLEALHNRANVLMEISRYEEALASYDRVIAVRPNFPEAHYNRGNALRELRRPSEACASYDRALALGADQTKVLRSRSGLLIELGNLREALDSLDKLLALSPGDTDTENNRNAVLKQLDRVQQASGTQPKFSSLATRAALAPPYQQIIRLVQPVAGIKKAEPASSNSLANANSSDVSRDFREALSLSLEGRLDEALLRCQAVLNKKPYHFDALHLLGFLFYKRGQIAEAIDYMNAAVIQRPTDVETLSALAMLHFKQGHHAELLKTCDSILGLRPDNMDALINRGCALMALQRHAEALKSFSKAAGRAPSNPLVHNNRGNALRELGRFEDALASFAKALTLDPNFVEAWSNQGHAFLALKRNSEALASYDKALSCQPNYVDAINGRAAALMSLGRHDEALITYDKAIALDPAFEGLYNNKATALTEIGRLDEAIELIKTAIKLAPGKAALYYKLLDAKRLAKDDLHWDAMQRLYQDNHSLSIDDQIYLHFGLAKGFADTNDHERAFRHWCSGSALKRGQLAYDEEETLNAFKRVEAAFTGAILESRKGPGDPSSAPIFIVGMPRSGSTLVEQILASHSKVHGAGEIDDFSQSISQLPGFRSPEHLSQLSSEALRQLGANYNRRIRRAVPPTAERVVDKMLENFQFVGLIHMALPNARIIHTCRDPIDTCFSCFTTLFNEANLPFTYDLTELGRYYRAYEALMAHWRSVLPAGVMLDLRYEDVVDDLEAQTKRILDFCGLDWDPHCLNFHQTKRPVHTASVNQVRQPLYQSSVGRARLYEPFLGSLLDAMKQNSTPMSKLSDRVPHDAIALNKQGVAFREAGQFDAALASFDKALTVKPDYLEALSNEARVLADLKRFDAALESYERALTHSPEDVHSLTGMGDLLMGLVRHDKALEYYAKALSVEPNDARIHMSHGVALTNLNRHDKALASFDKALELKPEYAAAYNAKGIALTEIGQINAASDAIETAIELSPKEERPFFYYSLSVCKRFTSGDVHLRAMQALAQDMRALTPDAQIALYFSLGKAFADIGDHEGSFSYLLDGNALKRTQVVYGEATSLGILARMRAAFSAELLQANEGLGDPSGVPIFIVGMPRSGSTLIEQLLASHPKVFGAGQIDEAGKSIIGLANTIRASASPETLSRLSGDELRQFGTNYVERIRPAAPLAERIIDKTLENFPLIGLIHMALPNARFIHMHRDPVDTCLSCFSTLFNDNHRPYSYDLAELGRYYRAYEAMMAHWRNVLPAGVMLDLRYEDVVDDLEAQTKRILDFCGLDWDPRCLDFHQTTRPVHTASKAQVRQPIYKSSVGRWRAYEKHLGPLLTELKWQEAGAA